MKKISVLLTLVLIMFVGYYVASASLEVWDCHKPLEHNAQWLHLPYKALKGHLGHGDYVYDPNIPGHDLCNGLPLPDITPTATNAAATYVFIPSPTVWVVEATPTAWETPIPDVTPIVSSQWSFFVWLPDLHNTCSEFWPWCHSPGQP